MKNKILEDLKDVALKKAEVIYIHRIPPYWRDYEDEEPSKEGIYVCLGRVTGKVRYLEQYFVDFCEYIEGAGFDVDFEHSNRIITHWLPVPDLPEQNPALKDISILF